MVLEYSTSVRKRVLTGRVSPGLDCALVDSTGPRELRVSYGPLNTAGRRLLLVSEVSSCQRHTWIWGWHLNIGEDFGRVRSF
jgi:hypothetical protein